MISPEHLVAFNAIYSDAKIMHEAGIDYVYIPRLTVRTSISECTLDALLCPTLHPTGYFTRLFLSEPLHGCGRSNNWTSHRILERNWHSWSWQNVSADQAPMQILAAHLKALL